MKKQQSDELLELIASLTASEKGYFRKYAASKTGESSDNLSLFNLLDKKPSAAEGGMKDQARIAGKQKSRSDYNYRRHYLFQLLVQSLHEQYAGEQPQMQLNMKLNEIALLFSKAQYRSCGRLLRKAMEAAHQTESFAVLTQLFQWQQKLMLAGGFAGINPEDIEKANTDEQDALRHLADLNELSNRVNEIIFYHSRVGIALPNQNSALLHANEAMLLHGRLAHCAKSSSVRLRVQYTYLLATISFMKPDYDAALKYLKTGMDLMLEDSAVYEGEEQRLLSWFCNLLTVCIDLGRRELFDQYLAEMKLFVALPSAQKNYRVKRDGEFFILLYALYAAISLERTGQSLQLVQDTKTLLSRSGKKADSLNLIQLYVHLAALLVIDGHYPEAAVWLKMLSGHMPAGLRQDIRATARFLEMILHFEAGERSLLESVCRSAERQLRTLDRYSEADKVLLAFFKNQLPRVNDKKDLRARLEILNAELADLHARGTPAVDYIEKAIAAWMKRC